MKLTQFLQVNFKLCEINANLRQVCKFSKGKNTRILAFNTTTFLFLTQQYFFFQHNEINAITDSIRIKYFGFSRMFLTASVIPATRNPFNMTCLPLSLFKSSYTFETVIAFTGFSVDNFKSTFNVVTSRLGSASNISLMQLVK